MARKNVSVTVRIPTELAQKIEKTAAHRHKSVSDTVRFLLKREMNITEHKEQTDEIRQIIRDEVNSAVKAQANRMAAMLTRITVLSASGYYAVSPLLLCLTRTCIRPLKALKRKPVQ